MHHAQHFVAWTLDTQRYAVWLAAVERVVRLVASTPVPQALDIVLGVINVQRRMLPVLNLLTRLSNCIAAQMGLHFPPER